MIEFLQNWIGLGADVLGYFVSVLGGALAVWGWYRAPVSIAIIGSFAILKRRRVKSTSARKD